MFYLTINVSHYFDKQCFRFECNSNGLQLYIKWLSTTNSNTACQLMHCKNWFVDLANILLYRLYVANLIWCESKYNTVFITDIISIIFISNKNSVTSIFTSYQFATCNLYNNTLIKSTNQFLQCAFIYLQTICSKEFYYIIRWASNIWCLLWPRNWTSSSRTGCLYWQWDVPVVLPVKHYFSDRLFSFWWCWGHLSR